MPDLGSVSVHLTTSRGSKNSTKIQFYTDCIVELNEQKNTTCLAQYQYFYNTTTVISDTQF
jgi:hypothetical protein